MLFHALKYIIILFLICKYINKIFIIIIIREKTIWPFLVFNLHSTHRIQRNVLKQILLVDRIFFLNRLFSRLLIHYSQTQSATFEAFRVGRKEPQCGRTSCRRNYSAYISLSRHPLDAEVYICQQPVANLTNDSQTCRKIR